MSFTFDPDVFAESVENATPAAQSTAATTVPAVRSAVTTAPITAAAYLAKPAEAWHWRDLRDYVVAMIQRHSPDLLPQRNDAQEFGIFSAFSGRWGSLAGPIAKFAFETQPTPGMWLNAPIGPGRFAKASDKLFAQVIVERHLRQT